MYSSLNDPQLVKNLHTEYLRLINFYMNTKRPSTFVRYYNIDVKNSTSDEKFEGTYDRYHVSNIRFDIYDFTPSYYLAPVVNAASSVQDLRGQMMDAQSSIVTYTIQSPRIDDLIVFYDPVKSGEIFRVSNLRTAVNAVHSNPNVNWFELELEYAPVIDPSILKIQNHYVYDLSTEKYLTYTDYNNYVNIFIPKVEEFLNQFLKFYNNFYDLYEFDHIVPISVNELIILFKKEYSTKFQRIFEKYPMPYGYLDIVNHIPVYNSIDQLPFKLGIYKHQLYNLETNEYSDYDWTVESYKNPQNEIDKMLSLSLEFLKYVYKWNPDQGVITS